MVNFVKIGLRLNIDEKWGAPKLKEVLSNLLEALVKCEDKVIPVMIEEHGVDKAEEMFIEFNKLKKGLKTVPTGRPPMKFN